MWEKFVSHSGEVRRARAKRNPPERERENGYVYWMVTPGMGRRDREKRGRRRASSPEKAWANTDYRGRGSRGIGDCGFWFGYLFYFILPLDYFCKAFGFLAGIMRTPKNPRLSPAYEKNHGKDNRAYTPASSVCGRPALNAIALCKNFHHDKIPQYIRYG